MKSRYLSHDEFFQILPNIKPEHRLIFEVAYETGLRIGDVLKIRKTDIKTHENTHFLQFIAEKTDKKGVAILSHDLWKKLSNTPSGRRGYMFPSPTSRSGHITRQYAWKLFKTAGECAGINLDGVSPHSLRKSFAADTEKTAGFEAVQKLLQHSNSAVTALYAYSDRDGSTPITWGELDELVELLRRRLADHEKG